MNQKDESNQTGLQIGFSNVELPVTAGDPLAGYGVPRICEGVHDPLMASICVLKSMDSTCFHAAANSSRQQETASSNKKNDRLICNSRLCPHDQIYVVLDVLAIDHLLLDCLKTKLKKNGLANSDLFVHAVHTHSAPGGLLDTKQGLLKAAEYFACRTDLERIEKYACAILDGILQAQENLADFSVTAASGICSNVASNRVHPAFEMELSAPSDCDRLYAIEITSRKQKGLFVFYACHPTILSADNLLATGDLFGLARAKLRNSGYDTVLMLNGSCGDLSCRYTRKASTFEEADRLAGLLADAVKKLSFTPAKPAFPKVDRMKVVLRSQVPAPIEEVLAAAKQAQEAYENLKEQPANPAEIQKARVIRDTAAARVHAAEGFDGVRSREITLEMLFWNEEVFVCYPGELFSSLCAPLMERSVHFISNTNGYLLYMADQSAHEEGVYEAVSSPFAIGEGEKMMRILANRIERYRNSD